LKNTSKIRKFFAGLIAAVFICISFTLYDGVYAQTHANTKALEYERLPDALEQANGVNPDEDELDFDYPLGEEEAKNAFNAQSAGVKQSYPISRSASSKRNPIVNKGQAISFGIWKLYNDGTDLFILDQKMGRILELWSSSSGWIGLKAEGIFYVLWPWGDSTVEEEIPGIDAAYSAKSSGEVEDGKHIYGSWELVFDGNTLTITNPEGVAPEVETVIQSNSNEILHLGYSSSTFFSATFEEPLELQSVGNVTGAMVTPETWIGAVIKTVEKGPVEAVWKKGGEGTTKNGDRVIWGYFYASPDDVAWGSEQNPDMFVKIWFDRNGRIDINFFHVSVPDIEVFSAYPYNGSPDIRNTATVYKRYIRQYYENGRADADTQYEDVNSAFWYWPENRASYYSTRTNIFLGSVIQTVEKGPIDAVWYQGGNGKTDAGHKVVWGYFYASPDDVTWGSENNPDLFVKIWFDANGRTDVNFFHVSVPEIEVFSYSPFGEFWTDSGMTSTDKRYIRYEHHTDCSVEGQNQFVYDVMTETYLWYDKVPEVDYTAYGSPEELLEDIKYEELDKWSYITPTEEYYTYMEDGQYVGTGFSFEYDDSGDLRVKRVYRNSPADLAGMRRSDKILEINGKTVAEIEDEDLLDTVFGEREPGIAVRMKIEDADGVIRELEMTKTQVTKNPVSYYDILAQNGLKIGYLVFDGFIETAREDLDSAFAYFKAEGIDELILDLRYNGGGRVSVAEHLASLIAGDRVKGEVFESFIYNDEYSNWNDAIYFNGAENALNLDRLICITTEASCSASEAVINDLKPFITVVSIGDTTCGKPVGMTGWDYCDIHLAPIEFTGVNADGEGDYFEGISPACYADDDLTRQFGDPDESLLEAALHYITNDSCMDESEQAHARRAEDRKKVELTGFSREIGAF
jgi:C-terminal processing protease CtpA/Prc